MPHDPRAGAFVTVFAGLVAVVTLSALARVSLPLSAAFLLKAAACFAGVAAVALARITDANHPFAIFGRANQVTTARAVFVALAAATIGEPVLPMVAASAAAAAMAVTMMDGVDGWIARREGIASAFGARYDMEVDALLILVLSILAFTHDKAGAWVILSGLLRYVFVAAGWTWPWMERPLIPSRRRQAACVIQIVALIAIIEPMVTRPLSEAVAAFALGMLSASFGADTWWLVLHRREPAA
jgi:phosphatidylglycerophosphate synthase